MSKPIASNVISHGPRSYMNQQTQKMWGSLGIFEVSKLSCFNTTLHLRAWTVLSSAWQFCSSFIKLVTLLDTGYWNKYTKPIGPISMHWLLKGFCWTWRLNWNYIRSCIETQNSTYESMREVRWSSHLETLLLSSAGEGREAGKQVQ